MVKKAKDSPRIIRRRADSKGQLELPEEFANKLLRIEHLGPEKVRITIVTDSKKKATKDK